MCLPTNGNLLGYTRINAGMCLNILHFIPVYENVYCQCGKMCICLCIYMTAHIHTYTVLTMKMKDKERNGSHNIAYLPSNPPPQTPRQKKKKGRMTTTLPPPLPPQTTSLLFTMKLTCVLIGFFQNAGEASVANLDRLRHANGNVPTAELRLRMQKVWAGFFCKSLLPLEF